MSAPPRLLAAVFLVFFTMVPGLRAQWVTETYTLKPGWNAIWLPLNVSHTTMEQILPAEVTRVHMWTNSKAGMLTPNPFADPVPVSLQWEKWSRDPSEKTTFSEMLPNVAYLVELGGTENITWSVTGKPEPPDYSWSSDGTNLIGFPLRTDGPIASRRVNRVFELDSVLLDAGTTPAFYYNGGPMLNEDGTVNNPIQIPATGTFPLNRFQAYWIKASNYTNYYGPINVNLGVGAGGLAYGESSSSIALRVKSAVRTGNITITLSPLNSVAPPAGQPAITGPVPLRVRGAVNLTTGLYEMTPVTAVNPVTVNLTPGEEKEIIFALDRSALTGPFYASTLRITDSLGVSDIRIPVSARPTPKQGLWVGNAVINRVDQIEPIAFQGTISDTANPAVGAITQPGDILTVTKMERGGLILDTPISGQNVQDGTRILSQLTQAPGKDPGKEGTYQVSVAQKVSNPLNRTNMVMYHVTNQGSPDPFTQKIILHSSNDGTVRLLQRAVGGNLNGQSAVSVDETVFTTTANSAPAFRTSSANFPSKLAQAGTGSLPAGPLSFAVVLGYDDDSNPLVHRYHPDHDNFDERFEQKQLPTIRTVESQQVYVGRESNRISRSIVFTFVPTNPTGFDPEWGGTRLGGTYRETVVGLRSIPIVCEGAFIINRVADAEQFSAPPTP
jgi:hypothetical protein